MKNLFNTLENQEVIDRINKLSSDAKPLWGKMTVAQMLAHSQTTIEVALGQRKLKGGLIAWLFGRMAKKKLMQEGPFKKNLPTAPSFIVKDERNFEEEKNRLIDLVTHLEEIILRKLQKDRIPFLVSLLPMNGIYFNGNTLTIT